MKFGTGTDFDCSKDLCMLEIMDFGKDILDKRDLFVCRIHLLKWEELHEK